LRRKYTGYVRYQKFRIDFSVKIAEFSSGAIHET
jgi:hypothetical protein